jgi:hypothetical protein
LIDKYAFQKRRNRRLADSDPGWRLGWHSGWRGATGRWCGRQPSVDNRRLSGQGTPAAGCCASPCRQPTAAGRGLWQLGGRGVTVTAGVRVRGSGGGPGRPRLSNRGAPASPGPLRRGQGRPFCFEKQSSLRLIELIKAAPGRQWPGTVAHGSASLALSLHLPCRSS